MVGIARNNYTAMKQWPDPPVVMGDVDNERACQICSNCEKDTFILPCAHFFYCHGCLIKEIDVGRDGCPTCRTKMVAFLQTHH